MKRARDVFATTAGIIAVGAVIGVIAATLALQAAPFGLENNPFGNPKNMGVCVACFTRDIAGALGLHRAAIVQYLRPEVPAFCLGAFLAALAFREFRPRMGSSPVVRFVLGMFAMIGALVFLGCPWRALLRLAGGDWNAIAGIVGLVAGIAVGVQFLKWGFSLGRSYPASKLAGLAMPFVMLVLLVLAVFYPSFGDEGKTALFRSVKGPGAMAASVWVSTLAGLIIGFLAQRTRFCTVGGLRDVILMRDFHLLSGVVAFLVAAFVMNLLYQQFTPGFTLGVNEAGAAIDQPAAHTNGWLNFGGMVLAGLAFTLAGGCPGRQVFLSGEGDGDAAVFVLGMLTGAGIAHNFALVSKSANAPAIVIIGLAVLVLIGIMGRERLVPTR